MQEFNCTLVVIAGFVEKIKNELGMRALYRKTNKVDESYELREKRFPYSTNLSPKSEQLSKENSYSWDVYS